jgi:hypothetical protein
MPSMNLTFAIIMATVLYKITKEKCIFARGDNYHCVKTIIDLIDLLCLTPLSAIFQLYHGDHFCGGENLRPWASNCPTSIYINLQKKILKNPVFKSAFFFLDVCLYVIYTNSDN